MNILKTPLSLALIRELNERFPNRCPYPTTPDREIWMAVGARRVVDFLESQLKRQQEQILNVQEKR